ncbi:hypothetical protein SNE40_013533 [Patella caerulea]|uniref:CARD domain-containing protein n=1 Tax=Patella caerulea TaxID=87958 RepID=A0AAN8PB14_PATCE
MESSPEDKQDYTDTQNEPTVEGKVQLFQAKIDEGRTVFRNRGSVILKSPKGQKRGDKDADEKGARCKTCGRDFTSPPPEELSRCKTCGCEITCPCTSPPPEELSRCKTCGRDIMCPCTSPPPEELSRCKTCGRDIMCPCTSPPPEELSRCKTCGCEITCPCTSPPPEELSRCKACGRDFTCPCTSPPPEELSRCKTCGRDVTCPCTSPPPEELSRCKTCGRDFTCPCTSPPPEELSRCKACGRDFTCPCTSPPPEELSTNQLDNQTTDRSTRDVETHQAPIDHQDDKTTTNDIRKRFIGSIEPSPLMDLLYSKKIITEEEMERIQARMNLRGRTAAAGHLWDILSQKGGEDTGFKWVSPLIEILRDKKILLSKLAEYIQSKCLLYESPPLEEIIYHHRRVIPEVGSRLDSLQAEAETFLYDTKSKDFVPTRACQEGKRILSEKFVLGIIGAVGDGKTIMSRMVANTFLQENRDFVPVVVKSPNDMNSFSCSENNKYLLIVDNMFGIWTRTMKQQIQDWPKHFELLYMKIKEKQLALIYTVRNDISRGCYHILHAYEIFAHETRLHLHENHFQLNKGEKMDILRYHFGDKIDHELYEMISAASVTVGFPYISRMCSTSWKRHLPSLGFRTSLFEFLYSEFEILWKEDRRKYLSLSLVFSSQPLIEDELRAGGITDKIQAINEIAGKPVKIHDVFDSCKSLVGSFITDDAGRMLLTDPVVRSFLLHLFSRFIQVAIKHCPLDLLMDMVTTSVYETKYHVLIKPRFFPNLCSRFAHELQGKNHEVLFHQAFLDTQFLGVYLEQDKSKLLFNAELTMNLTIHDSNDRGHFLHYLCLFGCVESLQLITRHSNKRVSMLFDVDTKEGLDICKLAVASTIDPTEKIDYLRNQKGGTLTTDKLFLTAVESNHIEIVQHLANVTGINIKSMQGCLHHACNSIYDNVEIIQFLVDKGAKVNSKNRDGRTPLHLATARGKEATIACLIQLGANAKSVDKYNRLPIHEAVSRNVGRLDINTPGIIRQLVEAGSPVNSADSNGRTPLSDVNKRFEPRCVDVLKNADISAAQQTEGALLPDKEDETNKTPESGTDKVITLKV